MLDVCSKTDCSLSLCCLEIRVDSDKVRTNAPALQRVSSQDLTLESDACRRQTHTMGISKRPSSLGVSTRHASVSLLCSYSEGQNPNPWSTALLCRGGVHMPSNRLDPLYTHAASIWRLRRRAKAECGLSSHVTKRSVRCYGEPCQSFAV